MRFLTGLVLIASAVGISSNSCFAQGGWAPEVRIAPHNDIFDQRIIAKGDSIHIIYWGDNMEIFYIRSFDNGNTWSQPFNLDNPSISGYNHSPDIISIGDTIIVAWRGIMNSNWLGNICLRKSTNNGFTWLNQTTILPQNLDNFGRSHICKSESKIFAVIDYYDDTLKFIFSKSTNCGRSWSSPLAIVETREAGRYDIACRDDTIHMVWVGRYSFDYQWETYYLKSNNGGDTWTQSINLSTIDDRGSYDPVIAINSNGIIAACWIDSKYSPNPWNGDLFLRFSYDGGENWSVEKQITYSHWAIYPNIAWSGDTLHVVWEDDQIGSGDIFYIMGINGGQNWDLAQIIDSNLNRSSTPDISVSGQHRHIVWGDWRIDPGHGVYLTRWDPGSNINTEPDFPARSTLYLSAYPNPFNNSTFIECLNLKGGTIEIFNPLGQLLKSIPIGKEADKIIWDATDAEGNKVSSGIYFARANAQPLSKPIKLLYIK